VGFLTVLPAAPIARHGIENYHSLDHPADRVPASIAIVRLRETS
jgi:hypothetical protein